MNFVRVFIFGFIGCFFLINAAFGCPRAPSMPHGRRTRGDNNYKLIIRGNPDGYVPGKTYNLLLLGSRTHSNVQYFKHFTITAEAAADENNRRSSVAGPKRVGRFQLFSDSFTKFSEKCINTVSEVDDLPKTEIQVMWVAPEAGSGCVAISAMVYENSKSWFADDGELTKIICEQKLNVNNINKECCACDEAKYNFVFEGIWSNETHPKDYPFAVWLTHFSDVVGASHDGNFSFWGENHIATDGFRSLAEWGSPSALEAELRTRGPRLRTLIKAAGLWYPYVNTNTSSKFRVDRKHHKLSLVSMFGPSPDWVVGISGLDLCTDDCSWTDSLDIDLFPWDAGTDSGISYMSPNAETQPRERMYRITTMYPEDPRAPFYNLNSDRMIPLAKLYIRKEKLISRNCDDDFLKALQLDVTENTEDENTRPECDVKEFTEWSPCSVTCGKGLRMRTREYKRPELAKSNECNRQLVFKEMCVAAVPECKNENNNEEDDEGEDLAKSQALVDDTGEGVGVCKTTPWADWSECSATCGIGITMRTRSFVNYAGRKKCPHIVTVEKQKCMKPECTFEQEELPDPKCPVTQWSDWSPCTVTCGRGVTIRKRLLLVETKDLEKECNAKIELHQQKECSVREDCKISYDDALVICREPMEVGPCRGSFERYAYNHETGSCETFMFGGCKGNRNNFLTEKDCLDACNAMIQGNRPNRPTSYHGHTVQHFSPIGRIANDNFVQGKETQDCVMSDWSEWSPCSVTCGTGITQKARHILKEAQNGGSPCPERNIKKRRCIQAAC